MDASSPRNPLLALPGQLAVAPHRLLFFVGAANVLLAMGWWTAWLLARRWAPAAMPQPPEYAGWMHAIVMQYQVLPPFMFGFLLTVFPRWMALPALGRWHYLPVGIGLLGGQLLTLAGLFGYPLLLWLGLLQTLAGWTAGLAWLVNLLRQDTQRTWHARSCAAALALGLVGQLLLLAFLYGGDARLLLAAIKIGTFALLLPIYFTVNHRMTPFFASCIFPDYQPYRPMRLLAAFWLLCLAHLALELLHGQAWLWLPDLALAGLTGLLLWRWWPRHASRLASNAGPALLRVLFLGFAWLPLAFALYAAQSLWLLATGVAILGRAPAHALYVGYFGSLLVAMVTRVTQGHSGRPLELGRVGGFAFVTVQLVALVRIVSELAPDGAAWQAAAGLGWLLAFLPWVLRSVWIYLTPRADGQAG